MRLSGFAVAALAGWPQLAMSARREVIVLSDAGSSTDDSWALALLLSDPDIDIRLVVASSRATLGKGILLRRTLDAMGSPHVPVAIGAAKSQPTPYQSWYECCNGTCTEEGCSHGHFVGPLLPWAQPVGELAQDARLLRDAVSEMARVFRRSEGMVDVLAIGPMTDLARLVESHPDVVRRARLFAMAGSIDVGYNGAFSSDVGPDPEYNIITDIHASQSVFAAPWHEFVLAPLDTTHSLQLTGAPYAEVREIARTEESPAAVVLDQYRTWLRSCQHTHGKYQCSANGQYDTVHNASAIIYDALAAYILVSDGDQTLNMSSLRLKVNESGFTVRDPHARPVRVALSWLPHGEQGFYQDIAHRLSRSASFSV